MTLPAPGDGHTHDDITWLGIGLAIASNGLISASLNIQKYAHMKNEALGAARKPYTSLPVWWFGLALNTFGEIGNLIAYGYAEATVVTPIGAVGVIFGAIIATFVLKEPFSKTDFIGFLFVVGGVILIVYSKGTEAVIEPTVEEAIHDYFGTIQGIVYFIVVICCTILLLSVADKHGRKYVIVYPLLCSMIASWTVLGCKCFMAFFRLTVEKGRNQFSEFPQALFPFFVVLVIIVCAAWSVHFLQMAMRFHDNNKVIPTYYATFTLACIIGAAIVYREFEGASFGAIALFTLGVMLAGVGVYLISEGRSLRSPPPVPEDDISRIEKMFDSDMIALVSMDSLNNRIDTDFHDQSKLTVDVRRQDEGQYHDRTDDGHDDSHSPSNNENHEKVALFNGKR